MDAVRRYSREFDDWDPPGFELSAAADRRGDLAMRRPACSGHRLLPGERPRIRRGAAWLTLRPLEVEIRPGVVLGHKHIPVQCVGSYVPGGRYPMFGSAQMSIIPAKVAGVKTVVACTPPVKGQGYYPATINAMKKAGADRIFVLGGVQAFAMMAFGMGVVPPADMLCGAGNKFVAEAKRQLFGRCGIDLLAGPTEIAVIADDDRRSGAGGLRSPGPGGARPQQRSTAGLPQRVVRAADDRRNREAACRLAHPGDRRGILAANGNVYVADEPGRGDRPERRLRARAPGAARRRHRTITSTG